MNKGFFLFTTPRCGSTPICQYLGESLKLKYGSQNLFEFFNLKAGIHSEGKAGQISFQKFGYNEDWKNVEEMHQQEANYLQQLADGGQKVHRLILADRLSLFAKAPEKYFMKLFPMALPLYQVEWISTLSQAIFLERFDKFDQMLSWLVSKETNLWYSETGIKLEEKSVLIKPETFLFVLNNILAYLDFKNLNPDLPVIFYEDFFSKKRGQILKDLQLEELSSTHLEFKFGKQNVPDKSRLIKNYSEIRTQYKDSPLQSIFPI